MKVLVTGSPGWLGNRLVEVLVNGWEIPISPSLYRRVRCLVLPGMDASHLKSWGCEVVYGDVANRSALEEAVKAIDVVFHLVGVIHPRRVSEFYDINTTGTKNLIDAAIEAGVQRFVYISGNSAAGHNTGWGRPMLESDEPRPYLEYGNTKLEAERIVLDRCHAGHIESVVLRPFWFYGPGQPLRQTTFFRMINGGRPILFGRGMNLRSLSYLDNTVQALILAGAKPGAVGQIYFIADEKAYPIIEIYQTIAKLLGVGLRPRFLPALTSSFCEVSDRMLQMMGLYSSYLHVAGEMAKDIYCSVEKAKRDLGYIPTVDLKEGMRRSVEWCRLNGIDL